MRRLVLLGLLFTASAARADPESALDSGTTELGLEGSLTSAGETTTGSVAVRVTRFFAMGGSFLAPGADVGYSHVREHDALDALASLAWTRALGDGGVYPFVAITAGVRQDWQGSFREARYPVGGAVGIRTLVSSRAAVLTEYRVLRITSDPVAAFTEQQVRVGVSILL